MKILKTQNEGFGFAGTIAREGVQADRAWGLAFTAIAKATGADKSEDDLQGVRGFLDARDGRHFADAVLDRLMAGDDLDAAISKEAAQHMVWNIGARTSREHGIPVGLPYLTGWVLHYAILNAEA